MPSKTKSRFGYSVSMLSAIAVLIMAVSWSSSDGAWQYNKKGQEIWECSHPSPSGYCGANGIFCDDESCGGELGSGSCFWNVTASCVTNAGTKCELFYADWLNVDCFPYCKLVTYNMCSCWCKSDGEQGAEGGTDWQTHTVPMGGGGGC